MADLETLKALAKVATPGPWGIAECSHGGGIVHRGPGLDAPLSERHPQSDVQIVPLEDAAYIAAASPDVVLALIARVEQAEAERDKWKECYERPFASWDVWPCDAPVDGKQKYRVAGVRHDGIQVLLRPIFLHDELVTGATKRAEAAEAELAALKAAWQPMETAPTDGRFFLAWDGDEPFVVYSDHGTLRTAPINGDVKLGGEDNPTHWQSLPAPPAGAPDDRG